MLAGHEAHVLVVEPGDDVAEFGQAPAPFLRIVRGVGEVAREDDEIRLDRERVHRRHRLLQRAAGVRVEGIALEAPMRIRELHEIELVLLRAHAGATGESGGEHGAADAGELEEVPAIDT